MNEEKDVESFAPVYEFDEQAAKQAEIGPRITDTGKYLGRFTLARPVISPKKGTHGIAFNFINDDDEREANYLTLWTADKEGKILRMGHNAVMALMALMGLDKLALENVTYEEYDLEEKKMVEVEGKAFTGMMDKPIGLVLQKQLYTKEDGSDGSRMSIYGMFDHETGKSASEKLDGNEPEYIDKVLKGLGDDDQRSKSVAPEKVQEEEIASDNFDDDIPF